MMFQKITYTKQVIHRRAFSLNELFRPEANKSSVILNYAFKKLERITPWLVAFVIVLAADDPPRLRMTQVPQVFLSEQQLLHRNVIEKSKIKI